MGFNRRKLEDRIQDRSSAALSVGRAARDLVHFGQAGERVGQADDNHALMKDRAVERGDGRLLATMLGGRSVQYSRFPKATGRE